MKSLFQPLRIIKQFVRGKFRQIRQTLFCVAGYMYMFYRTADYTCATVVNRGQGIAWKKTKVAFLVGFLFYLTYKVREYGISEGRRNTVLPCTLPNIDIYDESLADSFYHTDPINCTMWSPLVFLDKYYMLRVNQTAVKLAGYSELKCSFSIIEFRGVNSIITSSIKIELPARLKDDFADVTCKTKNGELMYHDVIYMVNKKAALESVGREILNETNDQLSIVVIGFDSVSQTSFRRLMPKTLTYLEEHLNAHVMSGYTKVGLNTYPNLLAALTGQTIVESWLPSLSAPLIYSQIKSKGYVDCYVEDSLFMTSNLLRIKLPIETHNTLKITAASAAHKIFLRDPKTSQDLSQTKEICFGNTFKHTLVLDYAKQCIQKYNNTRKFVLTWSNEITHLEGNYLQLGDTETMNFLKDLKTSGNLENTALIVMSDHGPGVGRIINTDLGRFDHRRPFLAVSLPRHLTHRFPHIMENLSKNANRLTSHFDLYETFADIFTQNFDRREKIERKNNKLPRGISLFREVPNLRSCLDAGIPESYCPCYSYSSVDTNDRVIKLIATHIVDDINNMFTKYKVTSLCTMLSLNLIKSAKRKNMPTGDGAKDEAISQYVVLIETVPGHALFDATVEYDGHVTVVLGPIERRTMYGNQSSCVTEQDLKPFCLCK